MSKETAQELLDLHQHSLEETEETLSLMSRGAEKNVLTTVVPIFQAQADVLQSIIDAMH